MKKIKDNVHLYRLKIIVTYLNRIEIISLFLLLIVN